MYLYLTFLSFLLLIILRGNGFDEELSYLFILSNTLFMLSFIIDRTKEFGFYLCIGFLLRVLWLFIDCNDIFPSITGWFVDQDDEGVHLSALKMLLTGNLEYKFTNYSLFVYYVYELIGNSRLVAQYINVVMGTYIIIVFQQILLSLNIRQKDRNLLLLFLTFYPYYIVYSGMLVRECWVILFILISLKYFVKWYQTGQVLSIIFCISAVLLAAVMHDGAIVVLSGYVWAFVIYNVQKMKNIINMTSMFRTIFLFFFLLIAMYFYLSNFSNKIAGLNDENTTEIIAKQMNRTGGGSAYLTWINVNSPQQMILYSPLKMFYFCFAPLPMNWRGINDVIGFFANSALLFYLFYMIFKNVRFRKEENSNNNLARFLCVSLFFLIFVFGMGTWNAGTAFRHKCKIFPIVLVVYAISIPKKKSDER